MEERLWHKSYPEWVPHEINPDKYSCINEMFKTCVNKFSDLTAFESFGKKISFRELDILTDNFAAFLQSRGMKKGDRIAIQLPNIHQYPIAMYGALKAGLIIVNINPLYTSREMLEKFEDSGCRAIVIVANFAYRLEKIICKTEIDTVIVTGVGDLVGGLKGPIINSILKYVKGAVKPYTLKGHFRFPEIIRAGKKMKFQEVKTTKEDTAFLQYTGGTTGVPKGAIIKHKNILAQIEQIQAWMGPVIKDGQEVIITPLPLYHIFSLTVNCFSFFTKGTKNVLIANPRDIPNLTKTIKKSRFTAITGVNTLFNALIHNEDFKKIDFSTLKVVVGGGVAVQKSVAEQWKKITGIGICEGYGLTESSPVLTCNPIDGTEKNGSIGMPFPSTDIKILSEEGFEESSGSAGEILAKGPQVMDGYWNKPEETALVLDNGWLKTGDIGFVGEDGFVTIVDRKKDVINVSGFNVYPNEIEEIAAAHPKVLEAGVRGGKDDDGYEFVKLFLVRKDESLTEKEIINFCKKSLTKYKIPREVHFRDELPKTNIGKILRRELK